MNKLCKTFLNLGVQSVSVFCERVQFYKYLNYFFIFPVTPFCFSLPAGAGLTPLPGNNPFIQNLLHYRNSFFKRVLSIYFVDNLFCFLTFYLFKMLYVFSLSSLIKKHKYNLVRYFLLLYKDFHKLIHYQVCY